MAKLSSTLREFVSSALLLARWFEYHTGGVKADTSGDGCLHEEQLRVPRTRPQDEM